MQSAPRKLAVAIACGGTGGHLFPGMAVAEELLARNCAVTLLISPKEVDQQAVQTAVGMDMVTLPAVGLTLGRLGGFIRGFAVSYRQSRRLFRARPHQAVLSMGGFTAAPPVLAGRLSGAAAFLHESNTVPGRANRWLARWVSQAFVGFPQAGSRLNCRRIEVTGTPVRPQFCSASPESARVAMGLDPKRPVLLVMGGSQGARGVNEAVTGALPELERVLPELQYLHLTGQPDFEKVRAAYSARQVRAVIRPFLTEMELAMDAANLAISRAGASSLAEIAAMRLPSILIPYPHAADNHQFHNARAFVETGAARMMLQDGLRREQFVEVVVDLVRNQARREEMQQALSQWHKPDVAARIAEAIIGRVSPAQTAVANGPSAVRSPADLRPISGTSNP